MRYKRYTTAVFAATVAAIITAPMTSPASASTTMKAQSASASAVIMRDASDCPDGWVCVWEWIGYEGAGKRWREAGRHNLGDVGWRDRITSIWNRTDVLVGMVNSRSWPQGDEILPVGPGGYYYDLGTERYPGGGTWNNKIDRIFI
ncbi:peptidase inhibitor family I36 protein [Nonomuraea sp. NPDC049714]|uniref:peptidase inhibitor family I36 protein n=1 Tax=Nonomuraea sp. NPDC049714 TaxID=3364357 RepID=UPI0037B61E1D